MSDQQGMTLLLCMLFMSMLLLFTIHNLNTTLLEIKMAQWMAKESQHFLWADQCLQKAEREFLNKPCQIDASSRLNIQDLVWWDSNKTCQITNHCRYVYQTLKKYPCMVDIKTNVQGLAFYRLTVLVADDHCEKVLLQSVMAVPNDSQRCEQQEKIAGKIGRQAWHQLSY